ncbi:glycosyltransferase family 2 protein [Luteimicrobium subarcticum]|uniref:glycosyltransferase family 2 protein n=1 Tax=Luteimicrobium subarcticum TaxID=620910 RepID=UPI0012FD35FF|nr:glycosyltransferase family 2 protein [Luteimicrobium subarcticum]
MIVITFARPTYVAQCLAHLARLRTRPAQVIVVDGSPDDDTAAVVTDMSDVDYVRHALGRGTMPESRQLGLARATGDVVAFIDDDAYVDPEWIDELVRPYADPEVVGVGGRAVNGIPGEDVEGLDEIGRLRPDGTLTGYFGADPHEVVDVDHLLGANMSFRRSALQEIGGIRGNYPGTCLCEESDISLRLGLRGGRLVFAPAAVVRHVAAPYTTGGQRFDRRYLYYSRRNHVVLLARVFGWASPMLRRYARTAIVAQRSYLRVFWERATGAEGDGSTSSRLRAPIVLTRSVVEMVGLVAGVPAAWVARARDRRAGVRSP